MMEGEHKRMTNGVEGVESRVVMGKPVGVSGCELVLRFLALFLTLAAVIVIAVDKETKVVPIVLVDTLPPLYVPLTAKWHQMSAILYFMVTNAIACTYAALSLLLALVNRGKSKGLWTLISVLDAFTVALLFSGNGSAAAVGVLGYKGNSHVNWKKVCNVFGRFCDQMAASIGLSLIGSLAFFLLLVIPLVRLHRRT